MSVCSCLDVGNNNEERTERNVGRVRRNDVAQVKDTN